MEDERKLVRHFCEAMDLTEFAGERWAIQANRLRLYADLVKAIHKKIAEFGYSALPVSLTGEQEVCRMEGDSIVVSVEQVIETDSVAYDTSVCCRDMHMRPVICDALAPLVTHFAEKDFDLLKAFLATTDEPPEPPQ